MRPHVLALALALAAPAAAQEFDASAPALGPEAVVADTSSAALRIEAARLDLARAELAALAGWRHWRPQLSVYASLATRGIAFPTISAQGYDPAAAAIARWPGDTYGLTLSWSAESLLDRRPALRARAAVVLAEARVDLVHARRTEQDARDRRQALARAERLEDERQRDAHDRRRAAHATTLLQVEAGFLGGRLTAQRDLLRLAEMTYAQGTLSYEALARQRLAVLAAEQAIAVNTVRLAAARDGEVLSPPAPDAPDPLAPSPLAPPTAVLLPDAP